MAYKNSFVHKAVTRSKPVKYSEMDFFTGKAEVDRDEQLHEVPKPRNLWESKSFQDQVHISDTNWKRNLVRHCLTRLNLSNSYTKHF